jgi:hypothetical protein
LIGALELAADKAKHRLFDIRGNAEAVRLDLPSPAA